jgi:hypothetical protein
MEAVRVHAAREFDLDPCFLRRSGRDGTKGRVKHESVAEVSCSVAGYYLDLLECAMQRSLLAAHLDHLPELLAQQRRSAEFATRTVQLANLLFAQQVKSALMCAAPQPGCRLLCWCVFATFESLLMHACHSIRCCASARSLSGFVTPFPSSFWPCDSRCKPLPVSRSLTSQGFMLAC